MSICRSCSATIMWTRTTRGENMPVDADDNAGWCQPVIDRESGNLRPTGTTVSGKWGAVPVVEALAAPQLFDDGERRWRAHWVTCPDADQWRNT